jgi:N6-adenosine-specific RNA methylase IME4
MLRMNIQCLQKDGVIFLWVTGRAMELGRRCLDVYELLLTSSSSHHTL